MKVTSFQPLFRNGHLATIASSVWPRYLDEYRFPLEARLFHTEPETRILVHIQRPAAAEPGHQPLQEAVLVHGLEGSSQAPYMRSLAHTLLEAGFAVHRTNIRSCGGTEFLCKTLYHAGFTHDLFAYLLDLDRQRRTPVHLVGFSLGGNMALKLAGDLGADAHRLLASVTAVSTPLDLKECSLCLNQPANRLYQWHFLRSMKKRLLMRRKVLGDLLPIEPAAVRKLASVYELDDRVTAPAFGFRSAAHYYDTQSARNFVSAIQVPTLIVQAKNDPLIPFACYQQPGLAGNPGITLIAPDHGGHLGFLSSRPLSFWADATIRDWMVRQVSRLRD
jgi:predicted alpha/beta-fold hydrolase